MPLTPEQRARERIDAALAAAGWVVQDRDAMNLAAGPGVAVREFRMAPGHGFADYMLFVAGRAAGVLEAKPAGYTHHGNVFADRPAGRHNQWTRRVADNTTYSGSVDVHIRTDVPVERSLAQYVGGAALLAAGGALIAFFPGHRCG